MGQLLHLLAPAGLYVCVCARVSVCLSDGLVVVRLDWAANWWWADLAGRVEGPLGCGLLEGGYGCV